LPAPVLVDEERIGLLASGDHPLSSPGRALRFWQMAGTLYLAASMHQRDGRRSP
jgi:hypothetical protein